MADKETIDFVKKLNATDYSPPVTIIDTIRPISQENIQRIVDDTPLLKKGIPALPIKMSDSVYLSTVGVPVQWRTLIFDVISGGETEDNVHVRRFSLNTGLDWRSVHIILHLVRKTKTTECYNTQGSLSKQDESLKVIDNCKWLISSNYKSTLELVSRCTKDSLQDILDFDQSLRYKRSKRDPLVTCTTPQGRSFCFVGFINDRGQQEWLWVDMSLSSDNPQKNVMQKQPVYAGPQCPIKGCQLITNLLRCSRCQKVYYCSPSHQKEDWPLHKSICFPPNK